MSEYSLSAEMMFAAARNLQIDRVIAEVYGALEAASIDVRLLKGPAIASWLYEEDELRGYGDGDLLVSQAQWENAVSVLRGLGFEEDIGMLNHPNMESFASYPWARGADGIDLHATLAGIDADFATAWTVLSDTPEEIEVGGRRVRILSEPARALHVALHATHHHEGKPMADLQRALQRLDLEVWKRAAELAASLKATAAFATGLRLNPDGVSVARRLGVHEARSVQATLKVENVLLSQGIEDLARTPGLMAKLRVILRELVPTPAFLRWWSPLARRGRWGVLLAYAWRPIWLLWRFPSGFLAWRKARRESRAH